MADISTVNLDAGSDSPAAARAQILEAVQRVNALAGTGSGQGAVNVGVRNVAGNLPSTVADTEAALAALANPAGQFTTEINVLRYIPPSEWAAILAGTSTYDARAAFQAAIDTIRPIYAPGVYKIVGALNLAKLATLRGDGTNGGSSAGSGCIFHNTATSTAPSVTMPITKTLVMSHIQDFFFKASSWDATTGALGHGLDIVGQLSLTRVQVIGFKKIGIYMHHDASLSGPYESVLTNVRALYNGQHGVVIGRGANSVTLINPECKWNGAPSYLTQPAALGSYDGLYVDNYDDGSGHPSYLPEGLTILGGDASYNSRYGWNIQGVSYGRIMPGYAEFNKATYDVNLGADLQNSFVELARVTVAKTNLAATFSAYQRTNTIFIGGKHVGAGNTNTSPQNSFLLDNLTSYFAENAAHTAGVVLAPDPATGNATLQPFGGAILTIGGGSSVALPLNAKPQFSGLNTTGATSAGLGTNSPATVATPYTWIRCLAGDGTTCFFPIWK